MEKNYKIIFYSKQRILYIIFIPLFCLVVLAPLRGKGLLIIPKEIMIGLCIWVILGILTLLPIFPKFYAKAVYLAKIDPEGILLDNIKPYLWGKLQQPLRVKFNELKSYKYEPSNNFDMFRLRLKTGKKIKFDRYFFDSKDDFYVFLWNFEKAIKVYNKSTDKDNQINAEKLIMDNKVFLWVVAVIIMLMAISAVVLISIKGINNPKAFVSIFVFLGPLGWVISQVIKGLKKKSE